jgi:hypothetical protein
MEGVERIKVNYTHIGDALRHPLIIDLNINNGRQDWKVGTVGG